MTFHQLFFLYWPKWAPIYTLKTTYFGGSLLSSLDCESFPGTGSQQGMIKPYNDSSKAPVLGVTAP